MAGVGERPFCGAWVENGRSLGAGGWRSALEHSHLDMVRFLVKGIDADVSKANTVDDATPLIVAAGQLHLDTVRFRAQETQADVNKAHAVDGATPLITAASHVNKAHAVDSARDAAPNLAT